MLIERRPDGSVLLTRQGLMGRGLVAMAGVGFGATVVASSGALSALEAAVVVPLGLIAILAGIGVARHRDWILFDRPARQVAFRRGLASIFRPVSVFEFDDVEAIRVEALGEGAVAVALARADDYEWPIDTSADQAHVSGLVAALREVGGWPVLRTGESAAVR